MCSLWSEFHGSDESPDPNILMDRQQKIIECVHEAYDDHINNIGSLSLIDIFSIYK